jgi:Tol biopolymer transport system component
MIMKKTVLRLLLLLGLVFSLSAAISAPAQAQEGETLDEVLARAAAKGFLVTLTRPELTSTRAFYLQEGSQVSDLGEVTGYTITRSEWVTPGELYQVEATLQPGNRTIIISTAKENSRWKVTEVLLNTTIQAGAPANTGAGTATPQVQPVAGNGTGKLVFQTQSGGDIYLINADGTGLTRLTHGIDPQLSPDGTKVAFTRWDPQYELFTINVDGTNEQSLLAGFRQMKSPTWAADGSKIIFNFQDGGRLESQTRRFGLTTLAERAIAGNPVNIPDNARGIEFKDGKLQFTIPPDAYWWLGMVDLVKQEYVDLSTGNRYNYAPTGYPTDPNKIILRADKGMMLNDLQAQGNSQPVSFDDRDRGAISVSPDGTKVAFTYFQDGHWEIHTINIDGTNRQRLTETPLAVVADRHTAGNEVYINEEGFRTMSRAQPGSMPNVSWNNAAPVWSPDGSQIAFMTDRQGKWEIWIMNADGSNQRPMFPNGAVDQLGFNFAGVDERMLSWR